MLRTHIPQYEKTLSGMLERTQASLATAYDRAEDERCRKADTGNDNPSTDVDTLVRRLLEIGNIRREKEAIMKNTGTRENEPAYAISPGGYRQASQQSDRELPGYRQG